jgi:uncharacterized protein
MKISIANLKTGANHFQNEENWQSLELPETQFPGAIAVSSLADLEGELLTVQHHLKTTALLTCDRCLEQYEQNIDLRERFLFAIDPKREYDDGVTVVYSDDHEIALNSNLREMLLLFVPMQRLCKEECQGLCQVCGTNHNHESCNCSQEIDGSLNVALNRVKGES